MNKVHQKEQESNKKLLEENTKLRRALMRVKAISENALISQELELSELLSEEKETDS
jgi:hypothetical protein